MDRKKHPAFLKPFRTPTMRSNRHQDGQSVMPVPHPSRERLSHGQNLGVANRPSMASQPVDDAPFDDFGMPNPVPSVLLMHRY